MPRNMVRREQTSAEATLNSVLCSNNRKSSENNPNAPLIQQFSLYSKQPRRNNGNDNNEKFEWVSEYMPSNIENRGMTYAIESNNEIYYAMYKKKITLRHKPTDARAF